MRRIALVLIALLAVMPAARGQELVADLSQHLIAITTGFTGAQVTLFVGVEGGGDVVVVVRGPERDVTLRRKHRVAGIWLNARAMTFAGVPSFYALFASRPPEQILRPNLRQLHEVGLDQIRLQPVGRADPDDIPEFRARFLETEEESGLYSSEIGRIDSLSGRLFRASLDFPANVPTGTYKIDVLLVRGGDVVAAQTTPLQVAQIGVEADISDFARREGAIYGMMAVFAAAAAGWLSTFLFRTS